MLCFPAKYQRISVINTFSINKFGFNNTANVVPLSKLEFAESEIQLNALIKTLSEKVSG